MNSGNHLFIAFIAAALVAVLVHPAQLGAEEDSTGLSGRMGLSYSEARGNSDTLGVSAEAAAQYLTGGPWRYDARAQLVSREESDVTTEERYEARATANYFWTEDDYFFARLDWRKDNFGGVREEWVPGLGYGRVLLDSAAHKLHGEIAAGYRFADLSDGTSEEGPALTGNLRYQWTISEFAEFYQNALVQWSEDNTFLESETGLRTAIIGNLNARISYIVRHNTDVPPGRNNSDFFTTVGLDYKF
ncbi:MAG: YdiY family protein [Gammaproteobacteria bacterium]